MSIGSIVIASPITTLKYLVVVVGGGGAVAAERMRINENQALQSGRLKNNEATGQMNGNNWLVISNPSLEVRQVVLVGVQWKL